MYCIRSVLPWSFVQFEFQLDRGAREKKKKKKPFPHDFDWIVGSKKWLPLALFLFPPRVCTAVSPVFRHNQKLVYLPPHTFSADSTLLSTQYEV